MGDPLKMTKVNVHRHVPFYRHDIGEAEKAAVFNVFDSEFLTTGHVTSHFESEFSSYVGTKYAVGVSSCTMGMFLALKYLGIGPGDKVLVPSMTFVASANVIEHVGATPIFVDCRPDSALMNLDHAEMLLNQDKSIKGMIVVHLYGQMVDMKRVSKLKHQHNLFVIEDCAHCVEGNRDGIKPGQLSDTAAFSFYTTKNITCGEGGAVATNSKSMMEYLTKARLHGMNKSALDRVTNYSHWDMEFLGYKCNMTDIMAGMLLPQLERIDATLEKRERLARRYEEALSPYVRLIHNETRNLRHAWHLWPILVDKRDDLIKYLKDRGIGTVVNYNPVHLTSYYHRKYGDQHLPNTVDIGGRVLSLPFYPSLTDEEQECVIKEVQLWTALQT